MNELDAKLAALYAVRGVMRVWDERKSVSLTDAEAGFVLRTVVERALGLGPVKDHLGPDIDKRTQVARALLLDASIFLGDLEEEPRPRAAGCDGRK